MARIAVISKPGTESLTRLARLLTAIKRQRRGSKPFWREREKLSTSKPTLEAAPFTSMIRKRFHPRRSIRFTLPVDWRFTRMAKKRDRSAYMKAYQKDNKKDRTAYMKAYRAKLERGYWNASKKNWAQNNPEEASSLAAAREAKYSVTRNRKNSGKLWTLEEMELLSNTPNTEKEFLSLSEQLGRSLQALYTKSYEMKKVER